MIECTNGFKPLNCQCVQRNSLASLEAKKKPKNCSPAANEVEESKSENTEGQSGMGAPTRHDEEAANGASKKSGMPLMKQVLFLQSFPHLSQEVAQEGEEARSRRACQIKLNAMHN